MTPPHPSVTAITHFNFSSENSDCSFYLIYSFFCLSLVLSLIGWLQWRKTQQLLLSPAITVTASGREPLQQIQRGQSTISARLFGGFSNPPPLAWSSLDRPRMQYVLRSGTSKSSGETQWQELAAEVLRGVLHKLLLLRSKGAALWREVHGALATNCFLAWLGLGQRALSEKC